MKQVNSSQSSRYSHLWIFTCLSTLHMLFITWGFFQDGVSDLSSSYAIAFNLLTWVSYSLIYISIAILPIYVFSRFSPFKKLPESILAVVLTSSILLFIKADFMIYDLYNFHFNGFIWNLITTPGGMSSLGTSEETYLSILLSVLLVLLVQGGLWWLSVKITRKFNLVYSWKFLFGLFLPMMLTQSIMYGVSDIKEYSPILGAAQTYPFYKKTRFRTLASYLGVEAIKKNDNKFSNGSSRIHYPLEQIQYAPVKNKPNIVILAVESLRWDRLTPEIMPNTWKFAQKSQFYKQHYSSGNGTREGLFGLFYGLYGSYWNNFLLANKSPLLMDRIQALDYQIDLRTSARFTYPEFNKTLFAKIPASKLHEASDNKSPWQRDEDNASGLISFVEKRDSSKPFMSFFFFESTHARYNFPEAEVIAKPYIKEVDYWGMSRQSLAPKINELKNRYTNAAHWVDIQIGRVVDSLEKQGLLNDTIIIITGDHGEEFLEKGFWGHNSSFVEEQTHTPMVIWVPNMPHQEINRYTNHIDIATTLMQVLGAPANAQSYSLGTNILQNSDRKFIVSSDWHSISVMTNDMKYRIPYINSGFNNWKPTGQKDEGLKDSDANALLAKNQQSILEAIKNSSRFLITNKNHQ